MSINQNLSNQQDIVTISGLPEIKSIKIIGIGTSETSGVSIDISSDGTTLKSSHSISADISQPRYIAFGFYTT